MEIEEYRDEELFKLNFQENVVRGFIKLLPRGEGIEKILFSMKDARESVELEKTYEFVKSKLSEIKFQQLGEIKDVKEIKTFLETEMGNLNELVLEYTSFVDVQTSFNAEIKSILQRNEALITKEFGMLNKKLDMLLNNPISETDEAVLKLLFNNLFDLYKLKMKDLQYDKILESIESIKKLKGYHNVDIVLREELTCYEAEVNIKTGNISKAQELTQEILQNEIYSLKICDFLLYYSTLQNDQPLFDKIFAIYPTYCDEIKRVQFKLVFWNYVHKNPLEAIKILCEDEFTLKLKDEFKESDDSYFYIGMSLFDLKRYNEAKMFLKEAYEKDKTITRKYYFLLSEAFQIVDRRSAIFLLTDQEKETLKKIYYELIDRDTIDYFNRLAIDPQKEYWIQRLTIVLHFDSELALEDYSKVPEHIKKFTVMKSMLADIFYFNNKFDEAITTLLEVYSEDSDFNLITKILSSYLSTGRYQDAIDFSSQIKEFDEEGIIYSLIITAFSKLNPFEDSIKYAETFINKVKYPIYIYRTLGELYSEQGDMEKAYASYDLMIGSIPGDDFPPRLLFAKLVRSKNFMALSLKCLRPYLNYSYEAQRLFVYDAVKSDNSEFIDKAGEIIDGKLLDSKERDYWLGNKVELEFHRQRYNTCAKYLKELFQIKPSSNIAYNYANVKIILGDKNVLELAEILERDNSPHLVMMGANCYFIRGDYEKAESVSLKALSLNGNTFNENLFAQYIRINLGPKPGIPDIAEIDEVTNDCVVSLGSDSELKWVGITSKSEILISENNFTFADTKFHFRNDAEVIHFIGCTKGNVIRYDNKEWTIKDIWKIKTRAVRFCIFEYTSKIPDSKFMKMIHIDDEKPLESMMPILVEGEIYDKETLADYNFRNGIGLPIYQVAKRKGRNLADAVLYLLEMSNQLFYTGEVSITNLIGSKIIISPTSIIMLSLIDLLDDFIKKYRNQIVISENTKRYFIDIVDKINTEEYGIRSSIGIEDGKYFGNEFTDDLKKKRLGHFNKIIQALSDLVTVAVPISTEELDEKAKYIELISKMDYESLKYASENNCFYLVDDLFVRKARALFIKDIIIINSASILYDLLKDDIDLLLEKIELLSKGGYNYVINLHALILMTEKLFKKYQIVGQSSRYEILLNIIHNSLSKPLTFQNLLKIMVDYINYLYFQKPDMRALFLIRSLLNDLWRLSNLYGLGQEILFNEIGRICCNDKTKTNFFYGLLNEISTDSKSS